MKIFWLCVVLAVVVLVGNSMRNGYSGRLNLGGGRGAVPSNFEDWSRGRWK